MLIWKMGRASCEDIDCKVCRVDADARRVVLSTAGDAVLRCPRVYCAREGLQQAGVILEVRC